MFYFFSFEVFYKTVIKTQSYYIENLLTKKSTIYLFKKEKS